MKQTLPDWPYGEDERPAPTGMSEATKLEPEKAEPEKPKSFKEAFAEARSAGDKTFTWNGKKYTTEVAGSKSSAPAPKASAPAPAPKASAPAPKTSAPAPAPAPAPKEERDTYTWSGGKRILAKIGTQAQREKYKAEGYAKGGSVSSASSRADGCAVRGKTRGKIV
jgi:hypothetical protein